MIWFVSGLALYAVVGFVGVFAVCLGASSGDDKAERMERNRLVPPANTDAKLKAAHRA